MTWNDMEWSLWVVTVDPDPVWQVFWLHYCKPFYTSPKPFLNWYCKPFWNSVEMVDLLELRFDSQVDILAPSAKRHPLFAEAKSLAAWMKCLSVIPCHLWSPGPIVTLSIFWVQSMVQNINKWEILLTHYDIDICTLTMYAIVRRLQLYTVYMHVIN